jgi:hypothetical protein
MITIPSFDLNAVPHILFQHSPSFDYYIKKIAIQGPSSLDRYSCYWVSRPHSAIGRTPHRRCRNPGSEDDYDRNRFKCQGPEQRHRDLGNRDPANFG